MKLTLKEITDKLSHSQIQEFSKEYNIGYERAKIGLSEYIHSLQEFNCSDHVNSK